MRISIALFLVMSLACGFANARQQAPSDDQIAERLIEESIASYPGPCACPYNSARNGSSCGRRSAYSREGGYAPLCFREDVADEDIQQYRQRNGLSQR